MLFSSHYYRRHVLKRFYKRKKRNEKNLHHRQALNPINKLRLPAKRYNNNFRLIKIDFVLMLDSFTSWVFHSTKRIDP